MRSNNMSTRVIRQCLFLISISALNATSQTVALDGFHNNETSMPDHYRWEGLRPGGFSECGKLIASAGGKLTTIRQRITGSSLRNVQALIIVDPDTPAESADPKYIEQSEIDAIDHWVENGGKLLLFGNDKGNAEFEHLNNLAGRFGIRFREETYPVTKGKAILIAKGSGTIFGPESTVYLVEVAPLAVKPDVHVLLEDHGTPIMALAVKGKGKVFAVGDPWLYNEYIDRFDNRKVALNLFRMMLTPE